MARRRSWMKVQRDWFHSPSHAHLSGDALHYGLGLLRIAWEAWDGSADAAWLANEVGPLDVKVLAKELRVRRAAKVQAIMDELVAAGTMAVRDDGAFGFPKLGCSQRREPEPTTNQHGTSTERTRKRHGTNTGTTRTVSDSAELNKHSVAIEEEGEKRKSTPPTPSGGVVGDDSHNSGEYPAIVVELPRQPEPPAAINANDFAHEFRYRWHELRTELGDRTLPNPIGGPAKAERLQQALADHGREVVQQVIEHAMRRATAGPVERAQFGRMFAGDGFNAALARWADAKRTGVEPGGCKTAEEAEAYSRKHRRAPDGWVFDSRGNLRRAEVG